VIWDTEYAAIIKRLRQEDPDHAEAICSTLEQGAVFLQILHNTRYEDSGLEDPDQARLNKMRRMVSHLEVAADEELDAPLNPVAGEMDQESKKTLPPGCPLVSSMWCASSYYCMQRGYENPRGRMNRCASGLEVGHAQARKALERSDFVV
jgi:hypothetical protein